MTTVSPDATLDEVGWDHMLRTRHTTVCVVEGTKYLGVVRIDDLGDVDGDQRPDTAVGAIAHDDVPLADPE